MKKLVLAALAFALLPLASRAQDTPKADVAVGYSQLLVVRGISLLMNGGSGSVALNVNNWLGAVGDFGVYDGSPGAVGLTAESYTLGPRFSYRKSDRFIPFAQVLVGGQHASAVSGGFNGLNALHPLPAEVLTLGSPAAEASRCGRKWNTSVSTRTAARRIPFACRSALCSASAKSSYNFKVAALPILSPSTIFLSEAYPSHVFASNNYEHRFDEKCSRNPRKGGRIMKMTHHNIQAKARELLNKARRWMPIEGSRFYAVRYLSVPLWKPWRDYESLRDDER